MTYSQYYQAHVPPKRTWFFVATFRSADHLAFDRTLDAATGLFEFFVPAEREQEFCALMQWYEEQGIIRGFVKLPNRYC